ncbi:MAG: glutamate--tRNA ligase family protein [Candidatus Shikimatogenerans bostrichidophilus]|nr:MAG: glutamate--tRNA ligase family protein [Candidatus Shikimatogenerans bostrichidophilus]
MKKKIRVRFAPSPTGPLHIGSIRTALYNYLFAKNKHGDFILRIDDTDKKRNQKKSIKYIIDALKWCKITHNEGYKAGGIHKPYIQSKRINIYKHYIKKLLKKKYAYFCFESQKKIKKQKKNKKDFVYNYKTRKKFKNSLTLKKKYIKKYIKKKKFCYKN